MKIDFYNSTADPRQVDKSRYLTLIRSEENCYLKEDTSIMDIVLDIYLKNMDNFNNCNYVYLWELATFYFVKDIEFQDGNVVRLHCTEDLLNTYKDEIKALSGIVSRQQNLFNTYADDSEYKVFQYRRVQTFEFPSGFDKDNSSYVLAIAGGQ